MERKVVKQESIYQGRIVKVFVDTVEQPDGSHAIREVVRHPGGAVVAPRLPDGRIVLVRQYRHPTGKVLLELPAGKLDKQAPPEDIARQELEEEAGYRAGSLRKLCAFYPAPGFCDEVLHLYLATDLTPTRQQLEEDEEAMTIESYTMDELTAMIVRGEIVDGKTIIGLLWLRAHLPSNDIL